MILNVIKTYLLLCFTFMNFANGRLTLDWKPKHPPFDRNFYEELLDPELCEEQLAFIRDPENLNLLAKFLDAGLKVPRGMTIGNLEDWGNYHQCLGINENTDGAPIEGKYCFINVNVSQDFLPLEDVPDYLDFNPSKLWLQNKSIKTIEPFVNMNKKIQLISGFDNSNDFQFTYKLAVCLPKPCTTKEFINGVFNFTSIGFKYEGHYCRVNNDKLWAPADYAMISILSILGLLTILSTSYDIWHSLLRETDPKTVKPSFKMFSLYTNTRRLLTFSPNPDSIECLNGIRAISMTWIIIGHTFLLFPQSKNIIEYVSFALSIDSLWVTSAPIAVDTFFMLSGLLLVYTTATKMTGMKLLKNLHLFYLNRLLRMFPLLAMAILLQASLFHWMSDGPVWDPVTEETKNCRLYWWTSLLYVQNYISGTSGFCLGHSWYLAVDMQMYLLSPLILFWVLGRSKPTSWIVLSSALISLVTASTIYIFINEFPSGLVTANDGLTNPNYVYYYYYNTLTRGSAFLVGMLFGYLIHTYRGKIVEIPKYVNITVWILALTAMATSVYTGHHPMKSEDWDNRDLDSLINSFIRPLWTAAVGWMIFACQYGYGGPINWLLSLPLWQLPSRLSYAMYIFHVPIMLMVAGNATAPVYFSVKNAVYRFFSDVFVTFIVAFVMTVFVDSPMSNLIKLLLGGGPRKHKEEKRNSRDSSAFPASYNVEVIKSKMNRYL